MTALAEPVERLAAEHDAVVGCSGSNFPLAISASHGRWMMPAP
jgi:hypothetical protein